MRTAMIDHGVRALRQLVLVGQLRERRAQVRCQQLRRAHAACEARWRGHDARARSHEQAQAQAGAQAFQQLQQGRVQPLLQQCLHGGEARRRTLRQAVDEARADAVRSHAALRHAAQAARVCEERRRAYEVMLADALARQQDDEEEAAFD